MSHEGFFIIFLHFPVVFSLCLIILAFSIVPFVYLFTFTKKSTSTVSKILNLTPLSLCKWTGYKLVLVQSWYEIDKLGIFLAGGKKSEPS